MAATESSTRAMAALDDLYRRHVGDVYRYTYAVLGNHADAEDVTQTTFVNALRALERGERPREASHWLLAIAHNIVRQRWRQQASRPAMVELVHDVPDEPADEEYELDELVRALQRIPPSQREALVMRELEGRSYKEISELLGLTTAALETLLFRARRSLAEELENVVTCQTAERMLSRQSDGRISRKERRRLEEHLAECQACTRFARTQEWQRKAFKGLAVLPVPVGLALFKGVPVATAGTVSTLGVAGSTGTAAGGGTSSTAAGGAATAGSVSVGGTVAGGSFLGGVAIKIAAVVAAAGVAIGVGYEGVNALRDAPSSPSTAATAPRAGDPTTQAAQPSGAIAAAGAAIESQGTVAPAHAVTGGSTAIGRKPAAPATDGASADEQPVSDGPGSAQPGSTGGKGGTAGGTVGGDGAPSDGGGEAEAPAAGPAAGGGADDAGPTAPARTPPASEPETPPSTEPGAGAPSTKAKGKATGKGKAKGKAKGKGKATPTPKTKLPTAPASKAKGPTAKQPTVPEGKAANGSGKPEETPKEPKATAPATGPSQGTPPAESVPPPSGEAPAADAPASGHGSGPPAEPGKSDAAR